MSTKQASEDAPSYHELQRQAIFHVGIMSFTSG
jgi:hypothetical protein